MATIHILGYSDNNLNKLNTYKYYVHITFSSLELLEKYIEAGFDPEIWEDFNKNKVLIKNGNKQSDSVPYRTQYKKKKRDTT